MVEQDTKSETLATTSSSECIKYGWFACRPSILQSCLSASWILTSCCYLVFCQQCIVSGISSVVVTSIEKRFFLRSSQAGVVFSCFDIGNLILTIVVSYVGYRHKPKWLGAGAMVFALGCFLFTLPQFITDKYAPTVAQHTDLCRSTPNATKTALNSTQIYSNFTEIYSNFTEDFEGNEATCKGSKWHLMFLLVVGQLIIGAGASPIFNLGPSYLDENVPQKISGLYLAVYYSIAALGSGTGFILGGYFLAIYVDIVQVFGKVI